MPQTSIAKYLNPWSRKRQREAERVAALRTRDGDTCARCRRLLRFDLPDGHDHSARLEPVAAGGGAALDNFRLTHVRCFAPGLDHTAEVADRVRRRNEAELFAKSRKKKSKAA